jgi:replicative DNA helicase
MIEKTESFCKDRALYNAIMKSITIIDGKDQRHSREAIPEILQTALGISFDTAVGHSYLDDAESRFDFYTREESKIVLDIEMLNKITNGGLTRKSLSILVAQSGGGKSLVMSHLAAGCLRNGYNVLYISMEMSEEKIAERIDANLLDVEVDKLKDLGKDTFVTKVSNIAAKTHGRLFIKEYPQGSAHTGHFRGLLEELKVKQDFVPDILFVDYLGICASARVKMGGSVNSYAYLK